LNRVFSLWFLTKCGGRLVWRKRLPIFCLGGGPWANLLSILHLHFSVNPGPPPEVFSILRLEDASVMKMIITGGAGLDWLRARNILGRTCRLLFLLGQAPNSPLCGFPDYPVEVGRSKHTTPSRRTSPAPPDNMIKSACKHGSLTRESEGSIKLKMPPRALIQGLTGFLCRDPSLLGTGVPMFITLRVPQSVGILPLVLKFRQGDEYVTSILWYRILGRRSGFIARTRFRGAQLD